VTVFVDRQAPRLSSRRQIQSELDHQSLKSLLVAVGHEGNQPALQGTIPACTREEKGAEAGATWR
jgi:hypothetical protein